MKQKHNNEKISDEILTEQYNKTPILGMLSVHFNLPSITIWRRCKMLGLTFKNGGAIGKFELTDILDGKHPHYQTLKLKNRLLKENILENKCDVCSLNEWCNKPISLQLDHIDGDSHNHRLENLRLLCPNCHSQTDTWCGKNK